MPDLMENIDTPTGNFIICGKRYCRITVDRMDAVQNTVEAHRNGYQPKTDGPKKASRRK